MRLGLFTGEPTQPRFLPPPTQFGCRGCWWLATRPWRRRVHRRAQRLWRVRRDTRSRQRRRLVYRSCLSPATNRVPTTALEAIDVAAGPFDIVYVDAGHNDWHDPDFGWQFDLIVQAARRKGAAEVIWARPDTKAHAATGSAVAYAENNANLRFLTSLPRIRRRHDRRLEQLQQVAPEWFYDGTHMRLGGVWGQADYLSRWFAAIAHIPCPRAWSPGAPLPDPCPHPGLIGPPADPISLY